MDEIRITPDQMSLVVYSFDRKGEELDRNWNEIIEMINSLQSDWSGEAVHEGYETIKQADPVVRNVIKTLHEMSNQLRTVQRAIEQIDIDLVKEMRIQDPIKDMMGSLP